jgi:hypothetical protein
MRGEMSLGLSQKYPLKHSKNSAQNDIGGVFLKNSKTTVGNVGAYYCATMCSWFI